MEAFILALVTAIIQGGPAIAERLLAKDSEGAHRKIREHTDRVINEAIAMVRYNERKKETKNNDA